MEKSRHIQGRWTPQLSPSVQSPTTPKQYYLWRNQDISRADRPPTNQAQVYRALLHQKSITYGEIKTYPGQMDPLLIEHRFTEPYYTKTVLPMEKSRHIQGRQTPTDQTQVYRALPHQNSITYGEIKTYPGQMDPLLIEHRFTEPYYTKTVLPMEKSRHIQGRQTPQSSPSVQSPTTPKQYYLWRNQDISRAPWLIVHKFTELYYTKTVLPIEKSRHISPTIQTQLYRALLHQTVLPIEKWTHIQANKKTYIFRLHW